MNNYPAVLRNYLFLMGIFSTLPNDTEAREDKGDREGIPHTHPIP